MEVLTRQFSMAASAPTETTNLMGAQESYTPETFFVEAIWNMSPEDWKILEGCEWTEWINQEDTPNPTHSGEEMKDLPAVGRKPPQEPAEETPPWFVLDQKRDFAISESGEPASPESPEVSKSTKDSESTGKSESRKELKSPEEPDYGKLCISQHTSF